MLLMRPYKHPPASDLVLERVLYALSDSIRLGIVRHLADSGSATCGELDGGRPKSTVSHHFKVLREAGLVLTEAAGTSQGLENSTLHIGLRVLSGCELRTSPARANCSKGTPAAIEPAASAAPGTAGTAASATGQVASALAGPAPTGAARITTVAF